MSNKNCYNCGDVKCSKSESPNCEGQNWFIKPEITIEEVEHYRQGFADIIDSGKLNYIESIAIESFHYSADRFIVFLGGESVNREYIRKK